MQNTLHFILVYFTTVSCTLSSLRHSLQQLVQCPIQGTGLSFTGAQKGLLSRVKGDEDCGGSCGTGLREFRSAPICSREQRSLCNVVTGTGSPWAAQWESATSTAVICGRIITFATCALYTYHNLSEQLSSPFPPKIASGCDLEVQKRSNTIGNQAHFQQFIIPSDPIVPSN